MIIVLTVYQSGAFISNLVSLNAEQAPFEVAKALLLHICLRAVALVLMYQAYFRKPEESNGEDPTLQKPRLLSEIIRQKNAVDGRERVNNVRTREEPPPE